MLLRTTPFVALLSLLRPTTTTAWVINIYFGSRCASPYVERSGAGDTCLAIGGNSWEFPFEDGCSASSWSGSNCEGSSTVQTSDDGCHEAPFGSIKILC